MPVILLQIDARDDASAAIGRTQNSLTGLDRAMQGLAGNSSRVQQALDRQASAYGTLDQAQNRVMSSIIRQEAASQRAAAATTSYGRALQTISSGADTSAGAQNRLDSAFQRMISTQERAAVAVGNTARSYQQLASAQDMASRADARVQGAIAGAGSPRAGSGGGGGMPGGDLLMSFMKYQVGFTLLSDAMGGLKQAIVDNLAFSKTLASTQSTTGVSPATTAALGQYATQSAASGTTPYSRTQIAQAGYFVASAGVKSMSGIKGVLDASNMSSAFQGATDPTVGAQALAQAMTNYHVAPAQAGKQAMGFEDVITTAIQKGFVQPTDVPGAIGTFGGRAASYGMSFGNAMGLYAQNTLVTRSSQQSAQDVQAFVTSVADPNKQQKRMAADLHVSNLLGPQAVKMDPAQWFKELNQATAGPNQALFIQKMLGNVDASALAMGVIGPGGKSLQSSMGILQATNNAGGATLAASKTYEQSDAARFDNAMTAFKTNVDLFAAAVTPFTVAALGFAASQSGGLAKIATDVTSGNWQQGLSEWITALNKTHLLPQQLPTSMDAFNPVTSGGKGHLGTTWQQEELHGRVLPGTGPIPQVPNYGALSGGIPAPGAWAGSSPNPQVPNYGAPMPGGGMSMTPGDIAANQARALVQANALTRGQHISVSDAQDRLTLALQGYGNKITALGIYEQAVKDDPTYSAPKRKLMDLAAEASVAAVTGKAGPAVAPFTAQNAGMGGLLAGAGSTAVRFGGGKDLEAEEIRKLQAMLRTANDNIARLLGIIAGNTAPHGNTANVNPMIVTGTSGSHRGRG